MANVCQINFPSFLPSDPRIQENVEKTLVSNDFDIPTICFQKLFCKRFILDWQCVDLAELVLSENGPKRRINQRTSSTSCKTSCSVALSKSSILALARAKSGRRLVLEFLLFLLKFLSVIPISRWGWWRIGGRYTGIFAHEGYDPTTDPDARCLGTGKLMDGEVANGCWLAKLEGPANQHHALGSKVVLGLWKSRGSSFSCHRDRNPAQANHPTVRACCDSA